MQLFGHIFLSWALLFTPVTTYIQWPREEDKSPEQIVKEKAKKKHFEILSHALKNKFGVEVAPSGWPVDQPEIIFVEFDLLYHPYVPSVDKAREIIVDIVSFISSYLNDNPEVRPYLFKHPFPLEKILIHVDINPNLYDGELVVVSMNKGNVGYYYCYQNPKVPSETFEEAKAKVEASRIKR